MRLLLIEDDIYFADAIVRGLRKEGYAVDTAYDGQSGYELAQINSYDLLILDLNLPDLSGQEICRKLRESASNVRILMLTALGEPAQRVAGLDLGADDYLAKPFVWEEMLARIRALLRRDKPDSSVVLKCGDLTLDTVGYTAYVGGRPLKLTAKEFSLLEYLLRHRDRVVTNEELLDHVWDGSVNMLSNTVRVHITALRRKLGDSAEQARYIETVQGRGYRILMPHHQR